MKVVSCRNGHFFDEERFPICPVCGEAKELFKVNEPVKPSKGLLGLFSFGKTNKKKSASTSDVNLLNDSVLTQDAAATKNSDKTGDLIGGMDSAAVLDVAVMNIADPNTAIPDAAVDMDSSMTLTVREEESESKPNSGGHRNKPITGEELIAGYHVVNESEWNKEYAASASLQNLKEEFRNLSSNDEEKTLSYFSAEIAGIKTSGAEHSTGNIPGNNTGNIPEKEQGAVQAEPVVGWVIAIKGNHFGESFSLHEGKNTLGRSSNNQVILSRDLRVSRECHASLIYEPKKREFYLQPGDGNGLTYLNDEFVVSIQKIKAGDVIEIGGTKLRLVPLCGADFTWEDYLER